MEPSPKPRYKSPPPKNEHKKPSTTIKQMIARSKPKRPGPFSYQKLHQPEENPDLFLSPLAPVSPPKEQIKATKESPKFSHELLKKGLGQKETPEKLSDKPEASQAEVGI